MSPAAYPNATKGSARLTARLARIWLLISRHPLWSGILATLILSSVGGAVAAVHRWTTPARQPLLPGLAGPSGRTLYRCAAPNNCQGADHVTFNSTVNTPRYGDERYFLDAKAASVTKDGGFTDRFTVQRDGQAIRFRIYINNNGYEEARGTRVRVMIPADAGELIPVTAYISAANAHPTQVWDGVWIESRRKFRLAYEFGSARIETRLPGSCTDKKSSQGRLLALSDSLVSDGVSVGINGRWPGTFCASISSSFARISNSPRYW